MNKSDCQDLEPGTPVRSVSGSDRVAVLVVHGVAAKVPNREFVNIEAITDLLTFQDEAKLHASYSLEELSTVKFQVNGLPPLPETTAPDAGIRYTQTLVSEFNSEGYLYTTRRNELVRNGGENSLPTRVHVHELFWADLSRPASPKGFHSIFAFLRLIYSVCILGPRSLPRRSVNERAGRKGFYEVLYWIQHLISWITRLYVPILATAFLGGILCLYLLTQSHSTVDAGIPVLVGLSVMIGFAVWCCASSTDRINRWRNWLLTGIICTAGSVLLALAWFGLGVKYDLRYQWGVVYIVASLFITGSLVLFFSSHRHSWWSWGLLLAVLLCTVLGAGWSVKPLAAAIFTWTDWFFAAYWYGWLTVCGLNLIFWLASGVCLLSIKENFAKHASGLWTACIAGTVPMALCIVVHLGFFEALCLLFRITEESHPQLTLPILRGDFFARLADGPMNQQDPTNALMHWQPLKEALMHWQGFTHHPAIQYVYLFLMLAGALAFCAALPSVTAEISPQLRTSNQLPRPLGAATSQMFDLLRLAGEIIQRYIVIAIPVVVWHVWRVRRDLPVLIPAYWCWIAIAVLGVPYIIARVYHERKSQRWGESMEMFIARVLIVTACFALPCFENQINLTWLLSVSALFILAGVAFLFAPLVSVGVDVTSWLQEYPKESTPRARIFARLVALLDHLKAEGYSGVSIVAHSQGTVVVIEALRYLNWVTKDRYDGFPMSLFTLGTPLRQLYAVRFPWIYDWAGLTPDQAIERLKAPPQVVSWTNGYGAGDYIGRSLWQGPGSAFEVDPPRRVTEARGENRREYCLGAWAHVHYWDWQNLEVAKELDNLIMAVARTRPFCALDRDSGSQDRQLLALGHTVTRRRAR